MKILFYDVMTPCVYTDKTLLQTGLGGTEATVIRVAHALKDEHTVYVAQHSRLSADNVVSNGVNYISFDAAHDLSPDVVILLRDREWLTKVGEQFSHAKLYFWMHNMPSKKLRSAHDTFTRYRYDIIGVSYFHSKQIARRLRLRWYQRIFKSAKQCAPIPIHTIYNPIDDALQRDNTSWKPEQMILTSTPYKGMNETLRMFEQVQEKFPEYQLLIATYGKWKDSIQLPKQVRFLGSLSHQELMKQVRESFCVFYPQPIRCETFGLVYAEANAVGTPVLAHDFGAASEVLSDVTQLIDGYSAPSVIEKITQWRKQRPVLEAKSEFRLSQVKQTWLDLLRNQ